MAPVWLARKASAGGGAVDAVDANAAGPVVAAAAPLQQRAKTAGMPLCTVMAALTAHGVWW
jgi:hypothetical protein